MDDRHVSEELIDQPNVAVVDYGDAMSETKQRAPIPRFYDSVFGLGVQPS